METIINLLAAIVAFALTAIIGKIIIPILHKFKFGQTIREVGPSWHKEKQGTPTMGGIMFIIGIAATTLLFIPILASLGNQETSFMKTKIYAGLAMAVAFGFVGFLDDYISIKRKRNLGLSELQKLILQFGIAGVYLGSVYLAGGSSKTMIPFIGRVDLGIAYYIISAIVIVGIVNAVNFSDGIDGLCSMVNFFSFLLLSFCASILSMSGINAFSLICAGACIGFLVWNINPAKVFMGDTGSLFLGGAICAVAFGMDMPILLLPICIVSLIEMLSVVMQVSYFKLTHGKRIFKMTPIHHHFEMLGWGEMKICIVFSLVSIIGGGVAALLVYFGV